MTLCDRIREDFTRVSRADGEFSAQFIIDNQTFSIAPTDYETESEAQWMRCAFAKAVAKMVAEITGSNEP